jgi:hypothetical protein
MSELSKKRFQKLAGVLSEQNMPEELEENPIASMWTLEGLEKLLDEAKEIAYSRSWEDMYYNGWQDAIEHIREKIKEVKE